MLKAVAPSPSAILPGAFTVDTLPDPADNVDRYARVTDLFGGKRDLVLASTFNGAAFWQPVRPVFKRTMVATADVTLTSLKSPSVVFLTGALGGLGTTRKVSLSPTYAFPGACFEVRHGMTGLGGLAVAGLAVGGLLSLVMGASNRFFFDPDDGWQQFS